MERKPAVAAVQSLSNAKLQACPQKVCGFSAFLGLSLATKCQWPLNAPQNHLLQQVPQQSTSPAEECRGAPPSALLAISHAQSISTPSLAKSSPLHELWMWIQAASLFLVHGQFHATVVSANSNSGQALNHNEYKIPETIVDVGRRPMQEAGELDQLGAKLCCPFRISVTSGGLTRRVEFAPPSPHPLPFKKFGTVDFGWG